MGMQLLFFTISDRVAIKPFKTVPQMIGGGCLDCLLFWTICSVNRHGASITNGSVFGALSNIVAAYCLLDMP